MADTNTTGGGIVIDGTVVDAGDARLATIIGGNPVRSQIVHALLATERTNTYASDDELAREVTFRQTLLSTMNDFQTGAADADYFVPKQLHPQVDGTAVVDGAWKVAQWAPVDATDLWSPAWKAAAGSTASSLLAPSAIFPYRGECAGAFQICVFLAARAALGDQVPDVADLQIGSWQSPVRAYLVTGTVGKDLVPGDYLYFRNKKDYLTWAPDGFWQGLNSMYMGVDALGTKHYSGLGAAWLSEFNLRAALVNAYTHDCYPHQVDDPDTEVVFSMQATVSLPAPSAAPTPHASQPGDAMTPAHDTLVAAGFAQHPDDPKLYQHPGATLGDLAHRLGFDPSQLRQTASAPAFGASHQVDLGGARCVVTPIGDGEATDVDAMVSAHVRLDVDGDAS